MKRHLVFVYWLLLLVSTLAIGGVAFYLLQRESARLRTAAANSAIDSGKKIASNLEVLVDDVKNNSMDALGKLPENDLAINLLDWKNANKYARSVILYQPDLGLTLPPTHTEERDGIEAYLRKPDGHWLWSDSDGIPARFTITSFSSRNISFNPNRGGNRGSSRNGIAPPPNSQSTTAGPRDNYSQMKADRLQIREVTRGNTSASGAATPANGAVNLNNNLGLNGAQAGQGANSFNGGNNLVGATIQIELPAGLPNADNALSNQISPQTITKLSALPADVIVTQFEGNLVLNSGMTADQAQWIVSQQTIQWQPGNLPASPQKSDQGWMLIGEPNDLRWLGWMRPKPGGSVRGLVLNWDTLAQPFANVLGGRIDQAAGYLLRSPSGQVVAAHFASGKMVEGGASNSSFEGPSAKPLQVPYSKLSLDSSALPGWVLEVYYDTSSAFAGGFMAISTILVTLLVFFVLVGGTLLMREARREAFEAARKTSFVSNVSHELKTPLTTIRMYAELLGEGRVRDQQRQHNYLATIIGESQRLTRLVNNVLDFSRLEQGRKQYHPDDLALAPVIENVLEAQRPRLDEAGFEIETDFPYGRDVRVHADRDALEQVLINLIDNAMKYASSGRWLGIRVSVEGEQAKITVSDHGPGVPVAHRERIFDTFHRVDDSITSKLPGAGLGLSIARRLLRDQEGDLRYVPNEPHGSSFVASLPLASTISAAKIE